MIWQDLYQAGWRTPKPAPPTNRYAMPCVALGYVTARQCSRLPPPRLLRRSMAASSEYVAEDKLQVLEFLCCERWAVCIPAMYNLKNIICIDVFPLEKKTSYYSLQVVGKIAIQKYFPLFVGHNLRRID